MTRCLMNVPVGVLMLILSSALAFAQATAQLSGRVTDQSGAVLPGVSVTVTQTNTGLTRTVVTDGTGTYVLTSLPTGPYQLEVSLAGFRTYNQTGIVLQVGAAPVINAVLVLSSVEESVTVAAATPLVDVLSAGVGEVVENERIVELPLQGRQVTDLVVLAGAAVQTGTASSLGMQGGVRIAVAGGLSYGVSYTLDGSMHNGPQDNLNLPLPFPDALQEFRLATSALSADEGVHSGASVSAVTKSGTNRFSGNLFEFVRDRRFNATNPFASLGRDGKRQDDGLLRNQFGGTLGGPIVRDQLFFFGAYQGTYTRRRPTDSFAFVPTSAMLAGDFTAFASPACNNGRQINLRAPFANNRIDPGRFSPAALNLASRLPTTSDPCGEVRYTLTDDNDEGQVVGKVDYQLSASHSLFGRYMATSFKKPTPFSDNILTARRPGHDNLAQSLALGSTRLFGSNNVNSFRFAYNRTSTHQTQEDFFEPADLGVKVYSYVPHRMTIEVTGGFQIAAPDAIKGDFGTNTFQVANDLAMVRGRHQLSIGGNVAHWEYNQAAFARGGGNWLVDGHVTGSGLADFLIGRLDRLEHGGPTFQDQTQLYLGLYVQDTWRASNRVTFNLGLRWEPFFGQHLRNAAVANFSLDNFRHGVRSTVFHNAPAGLLYVGDPGFPTGKTGMDKQWWNLSPRIGIGWDVNGDGRTAVRSSYGIAYDFPTAEYHFINTTSPPFGNRSRIEDPPGGFDDPYAHLGGDPHPIVTGPDTVFPLFGSFGTLDPEVNSTRVQMWNFTFERQIGAAWQAAASYLGSYTDRLWGAVAVNPSVFLGFGPCTINGIVYDPCTQAGNLNNRRVLFLENPQEAQLIGAVDFHTDAGTREYRGLKLSLRRRAASGVSVAANYTRSYCVGNTTPNGFAQISAGYTKPDDPRFDRGNCPESRTHVANLTFGVLTPQFGNSVVRAFASDWRVSGILNTRSGSWLNVTTGRDTAFNGLSDQRVNQVSDDVYGEKRLTSYLNPVAFALPAAGTFGDYVAYSVKGPGFWTVDLALSKLISLVGAQRLELRVEVFNLFNTFNWGNPTTNFTSRLFGQIRSMEGAPRILQFGVKYGF